MLKKAATLSLVTYFLHVTTWEGHIFHRPAEWLRSKLPESLRKPLFDCPICMTPYYGALMLALEKGSRKSIVNAIMTIAAAAGISSVLAILSKFYSVAILLEEDLEREGTIEEKDVDEVIAGLEKKLQRLRELKGEDDPKPDIMTVITRDGKSHHFEMKGKDPIF